MIMLKNAELTIIGLSDISVLLLRCRNLWIARTS